jgi:hypothetical protein
MGKVERGGTVYGYDLVMMLIPMTDPWCWYIFFHKGCILMVNVTIYSIHGSYGIYNGNMLGYDGNMMGTRRDMMGFFREA